MTETSEPQSLAGYIQARMHEMGIESIRALSRRTGLSVMACSRLKNGDYHRAPDEQTLQAVSSALGLPLTRLRELAGRPSGERGPFRLPPEFDQLNAKQREAVVAVGRALLESSRGVTLSDDETSTPPPFRLVGRARQPEE
jgi:transcriptional regulator with XRE-family HTH domain